MPEQHPIGGCKGKRVGCRFFPGEMRRLGHQLARLHAAELSERSVWRLVSPDALGGREERIAAIALLVIAVVLIAVDDDFIPHFPAPDLRPAGPDNAGSVGTGDVK